MKNSVEKPNLFTVPEAAKLCGVSRNTLYTWVVDGKLPAYKTPGRTNLIRPTDLVKFMQDNGMFVPNGLMELAQADEKKGAAIDTTPEGDDRVVILVADDDSVTRALVVRALDQDYQIYQAETGYEALHLITLHEKIQLAILDLRMPGQHGLSTLEEIKNTKPDVSVIVLTGFSADVPEDLISDGSIKAVLQKPIDIPTIRAAVGDVCAKLKA
jgi:excisionase family DNA binding protein